MTITLTGSVGSLFERLKAIYRAIRSTDLYAGNTALNVSSPILEVLGDSFENILAQYEDNEHELVAGLAAERDGGRSNLAGLRSSLFQLAENTLIQQVTRTELLTENSVEAAWRAVLTAMAGGGSIAAGTATTDVDASTVTASVSAATTMVGTRTNNGSLAVTVKRPDGRTNELCHNETIEARCATSEQTDGTSRAETWDVNGEVAVDPLEYNWPQGSGATATLTTVDATQNDGGGNLLANSSFNTFATTNQPDYWGAALVGTYGTTILEESSTVYRAGTKCLEFVGDGGGTLSSIAQSFAADALSVSVSGTTGTLLPNTRYLVNFFARKSASLSAGVIQVRLLNSSNSLVNDDTAGATTNSFTVAHGDLSSSDWTAVTGVIVTPKVLPVTGLKFGLRVSTALTNGESVFIADLAMTEAVEVYPGGPCLAYFAGSTDPIIGDQFNISVANGFQGQIQLDTDRVFDLKALRLQLPSDTGGTEAVADLPLPTYLHEVAGIVATIDPFNGNNAATLSDAIDMTLFSQVTFVLLSGAIDHTIDFKIQEADTSGGSYSDIAGKAITQESGGDDDNKQWMITVKASEMGSGKFFLKALVTIGNGTTNLIALVALGVPVTPPAQNNDLASVSQVIA